MGTDFSPCSVRICLMNSFKYLYILLVHSMKLRSLFFRKTTKICMSKNAIYIRSCFGLLCYSNTRKTSNFLVGQPTIYRVVQKKTSKIQISIKSKLSIRFTCNLDQIYAYLISIRGPNYSFIAVTVFGNWVITWDMVKRVVNRSLKHDVLYVSYSLLPNNDMNRNSFATKPENWSKGLCSTSVKRKT